MNQALYAHMNNKRKMKKKKKKKKPKKKKQNKKKLAPLNWSCLHDPTSMDVYYYLKDVLPYFSIIYFYMTPLFILF
jgi:hypothetical protein